MKREIKFRAWDNENQIMLHGNNGLMMFLTCGVLAWQFAYDLNPLQSYMKQDRYELMQFTGLKDKNGKEIYEGDLLNQLMYPPNKETGNYDSIPVFVDDNIIQVGFEDGCFTDFHGSHLWRLICNINDSSKTDYEIIGNIYQNTELLK